MDKISKEEREYTQHLSLCEIISRQHLNAICNYMKSELNAALRMLLTIFRKMVTNVKKMLLCNEQQKPEETVDSKYRFTAGKNLTVMEVWIACGTRNFFLPSITKFMLEKMQMCMY